MSKNEFINRLEQLLQDIPKEERQEALRYYEDYFADADDQKEDELVEKLGSPEQIARQIKLDLYNKASKEGGIYTENGYSNSYFTEEKKTPEVVSSSYQRQQAFEGQQAYGQQGFQNQTAYGQANYQNQSSYQQQYQPPAKKQNAALIILLVITAPIWAGGVFGIVVGAAGALFGITVASICVFGGLAIGAVACLGAGIAQLFISPLAGVLCIGAGFILLGISLLALIVFLLIVTRFLPWMIRGIVNVCQKLFHREERKSWVRQ